MKLYSRQHAKGTAMQRVLEQHTRSTRHNHPKQDHKSSCPAKAEVKTRTGLHTHTVLLPSSTPCNYNPQWNITFMEAWAGCRHSEKHVARPTPGITALPQRSGMQDQGIHVGDEQACTLSRPQPLPIILWSGTHTERYLPRLRTSNAGLTVC